MEKRVCVTTSIIMAMPYVGSIQFSPFEELKPKKWKHEGYFSNVDFNGLPEELILELQPAHLA